MDAAELKNKGVPVFNEKFTLKISRDGMKAFVVPKGEGVSMPGSEVMKNELQKRGITVGILSNPVLADDQSYTVAKGIPPQPGDNAKIRFHVKPSVVRTPKVKDPGKNDKVDYRELGLIVNVKEDQLLFEKIPLTKGTPGKNVLGEEVPSKAGKDVKVKIGAGVRLEEEENKFYASISGKFVMADEKASVYEEHIISDDVDLNTGNVTFVGASLQISGGVIAGFKVKNRGDISIAKGINNAEILAGGKIEITGGVIGETAVVTAMDDVMIDFVENGPQISAGGALKLKDASIQANVKACGTLKALEGKGLVVGGTYIVGGSIYVKELGSDAEVITEVSVGMNPALEKKKNKLAEDQEVWPERMNETLKNINGLNKLKKESGGKLPPEKQELLDKYNAFLPKVMEKVNQLTEIEDELSAELDKCADECVYVLGTLYPGVKVKIGNAVRVIAGEEHCVAVRLDKKSLKIRIDPMTADETAMFAKR